MNKTRFVPLSIFVFGWLLLTGLTAEAQLVTNNAVLQNTSRQVALQQKAIYQKLMVMARKKGWPMTIKNRNGRLAYLTGIDSRGFPLYVGTKENIISAATIRTNLLWSGDNTGGIPLNGSSSFMNGKIAIWDEGAVRPTHVELAGRVMQKDNPSAISDHSTHVAGTMIASGVNPLAKGMAFGAQQLLAYDFTNDVSEMSAAASTNNLLISNHSYGVIAGWNYNSSQSRWEFWGNPGDTVDYKYGNYDKDSQLWDSIAYNAPYYMIAKASGNDRNQNGPAVGTDYWRFDPSGIMQDAGNRPPGISSNNGYDIISTYGTAKDILTVGAVGPIPGGYSKPSDVVLTDFSSWGPTADGRIKPDVVADGVNILSCIGTADNAYDIYSGSSMATPAASGSAFLLQEYYYKLHSTFMKSSTLKGLLIHTADEAGPYPGPDYQFGWGLINMQKAAAVITADASTNKDQLIYESSLASGTKDADSSLLVVASGKMPLAATLAWTDPPGVPNTVNLFDTTRKLINDLDLRITDETTGTAYTPWVLNPLNRPAPATTGDNVRDNVEKVELPGPIPGRSYKIKISHKAALARGSQAFSLLLSGAGGTAYCSSTSTGGGGTRIDNVSFGGINNNNSSTPACKTYSDFTGTPAAQLPIGQSLPITITYSSCSAPATTNIAVYIDFNNNGSFSDAGELVLQNSSLLTSGTGVPFSGSITVPGSALPNRYSRMRIVAQDNASFATPAPCGSYTNGETQDYRVLFTAPSNDAGVTQLEYPTSTTCANDSQLVAVRIRNFGTSVLTSVPVSTTIKAGNTALAVFNEICRDTIAPGNDVVYTYQASFPSAAGTTYTFISKTNLNGDPDPSNDQDTSTLTVSMAGAALSGTATLCSPTSASLKANAMGNDIALWYSSANASTLIAAGNNTTTNLIPSNHIFYLGLNDLKSKLGPSDKLVYANGAYFAFGGNYIKFSTSIPLTIESAKMYIGNSGKIAFTLATQLTVNGGTISYHPVYNTTIDVYNTNPVPQPGSPVSGNPPADAGAIFYLNIPVPVPGNYFLIVTCLDGANAFLNSAISSNPYPYSIPGVISITGNDGLGNAKGVDSLTAYQKFYYPFYNLSVRLTGCPAAARTPVTATATTTTAPVITLNGNVFTSNVASGNQWYRNGVLIPDSTGQTLTAVYSGVYKTEITDASGCSVPSNEISFLSTGVNNVNGASIGLKVSPNPNSGRFQLQFYSSTQANLSISLFNTLGQNVYMASYPAFIGQFSQEIEGGSLATGLYILKIGIGGNSYITKILVR